VGHKNHGEPYLLPNPKEQVVKAFAGFGVEVSRRLVGKKERRVIDQRSGHGNALLLATRQLPRAMIKPILETDRLEKTPSPTLCFTGRKSCDSCRHRSIF
jgi:hypothetical protein